MCDTASTECGIDGGLAVLGSGPESPNSDPRCRYDNRHKVSRCVRDSAVHRTDGC
jgi:hypothetical protein